MTSTTSPPDGALTAELRGLLAKATPGPWHTGGVFMPGHPDEHTEIWNEAPPGLQSGDEVAQYLTLADAALIVAAINALPGLLEAAEALQELVSIDVAWDGWTLDPIRNRIAMTRARAACAALEKL